MNSEKDNVMICIFFIALIAGLAGLHGICVLGGLMMVCDAIEERLKEVRDAIKETKHEQD